MNYEFKSEDLGNSKLWTENLLFLFSCFGGGKQVNTLDNLHYFRLIIYILLFVRVIVISDVIRILSVTFGSIFTQGFLFACHRTFAANILISTFATFNREEFFINRGEFIVCFQYSPWSRFFFCVYLKFLNYPLKLRVYLHLIQIHTISIHEIIIIIIFLCIYDNLSQSSIIKINVFLSFFSFLNQKYYR